MTILLQVEPPKPIHRNPEVKQGQTYRIIEVGSGSYQDYVGRYFMGAFCAGNKHVVYMDDSASTGGYDSLSVLTSHGFKFVVANLQEV